MPSRQSDISTETEEEQLVKWARIFNNWERAGVGGDTIVIGDLKS